MDSLNFYSEVVLKSKENEGTEFKITIPYKKVAETVVE
ncbi:MAG: hypothetical protein RL234_1462, partial [Pseudomonadota bacterium]